MEQDRYANNNVLYIIGIISLLLSLGLLLFSFFILPFLIWDLNYDVPEFITNRITYFQEVYRFNLEVSKLITWSLFFIPALITGYIAYYISNYIDNEILEVKTEDEKDSRLSTIEIQEEIKASLGLAAKILILMILIVGVILLMYALIESTSSV